MERALVFPASCLFCLLYLCGTVAAGEEAAMIRKVHESFLDAEALTLSGGKYAADINSRNNQQAAIVTYAGFQYAVYYDRNRHVCLARRKLPHGHWEILRFTDYTFTKQDSHCSINMGVCPRDGTIHLAFDHHGNPLHYRVSIPGIASNPKTADWSVDSFGPVRSALQEGRPLKITYPRFWQTPDGGLQFSYRVGHSGSGDRFLADYNPEASRWGDSRQLTSRRGSYGGSKKRSSYPSGFNYGPGGRLHVAWVWREGPSHPNHDLNYAYSADQGRTWRNSANEVVELPLSIDTPGVRVVEIGFDYGLGNGNGQTVDSEGRVHVVVRHCSDASFRASGHRPGEERWGAPAARRYHHYWRTADGQWHHHEMNWVAHGGSKVYCDAQDNIYCTYSDGENLVFAGATAASGWTDWRVLHREAGPFISSFTGDSSRVKREGVLSVLAQDMPEKAGQPTPLRVLDFALGKPVFPDETVLKTNERGTVMSSKSKSRNDLTWDDEVGMWRGDIALKEDVHVIRWSARELARAALKGTLDRIPVERVLANVRRGQEKEGDLRGNFWMTLEDGKVTDRNNGFFTTFHLLLLKHDFADQLTEKAYREIDHMLSEAEHWFTHKCLPVNERKLRYPNAFLGDAVCLWLVRELNGAIDSEFRKTFQEILTYYRENNWGWGEHLSDGYSKWCIRECAALLMWAENLDETTRGLAEGLAEDLMAIDAQFAGGPRVPTLRCYEMDKSPRTPDSHPERYRQYRELMQSKMPEGTASPLDIVAGQHGVFSDLVPAEPDTLARTIPCYDDSRAESWVTPRWRYGAMTRYPLFEDTNRAATWGLHWQSMPVAFWHCAGDWGYLQWVTEEDGVLHALPGFTKKHTQRNNLCRLSDTDETATCGLTRGARLGDALVVYRELPGVAEAWPWAADRFRVVYPTADARTDEVNSWYRLILDYGEEVLTVACRPLQDGTECRLETNAAPEVTGENLERRKAHELHFTAHHELSGQHAETLRFLWFLRMAETESQPPHVKQVNGEITAELPGGDTMRWKRISPMKDQTETKKEFEKAYGGTWQEVFSDACTGDWQEKWFLDGEIGKVKTGENGMTLTAGPEFKNDAHHMVLWTQESFEGDLKIEYDYTRLDEAKRCTTILYIQATGSGQAPYARDITEWTDLRKVPAMKTYYNNMNLYHISYAAFGNNSDDDTQYIRARRYMPHKTGLKGTDLEPDYTPEGLFDTGVKHHITVTKRKRDIYMRVENGEATYYCHMTNPKLPVVTEGRIGLRHMFTRSATYKDITISVPRE